jgi:hypothetical protein
MITNHSVTVPFEGTHYVAEAQARLSEEDFVKHAARTNMFTGTAETREAKARNLHAACVKACEEAGIVPERIPLKPTKAERAAQAAKEVKKAEQPKEPAPAGNKK